MFCSLDMRFPFFLKQQATEPHDPTLTVQGECVVDGRRERNFNCTHGKGEQLGMHNELLAPLGAGQGVGLSSVLREVLLAAARPLQRDGAGFEARLAQRPPPPPLPAKGLG